jgi:GNAT superfamily N-acetyltransferase
MPIETATPNDIPDLARIHVAGWRAAYSNLVDQAYLDALDEAEKARQWAGWFADGATTTLIARDDDEKDGAGQATGFVSFGRLKTPPPGMSPIRPLYSAEIYAIYLLPAVWRQGLGRALLREAAVTLKTQKHKSLCLWVMDGNKRANDFYKALGGQRIGKKQVEVGGKMLPEAAYGWRDTASLMGGI